MTTNQFLNLLENNSEKGLLFFYSPENVVKGGYHITEIKKVNIESVDCGGRPSEDQQTVVQLWLPENLKPESHMKAGKALSIFKKVDSVKPLYKDAEIYFEYGDKSLQTSNYAVKKVKENEDSLEVFMEVPATACKPQLELAALTDCCTTPGCC